MRLPRLTTRRLMVLVAVVAMVLGAVDWGRRLKRRREHCLRTAIYHARMERFFRGLANPGIGDNKILRISGRETIMSVVFSGVVLQDGHVRPPAVLVPYHAQLQKKYLHFASRPWIPVPPDPPPPE